MVTSRILRLAGFIILPCLQSFAAVTVEKIKHIPAGWSHTSTPSDSKLIALQVALSMQNLDQLESKLAAISTPSSPLYGEYLDLDDVNEIFGASEESHDAVKSWLESSGVKNYTRRGNSIWFKANISTANAMLGTNFNTYTDSAGAQKIRTTGYSIPEDLVDHIDLITPTTYFGTSRITRKLKTKAIKA